MTSTTKLQTADIRVTECRGGGFVVHIGAEMYAACASPYDVAHAMATLLAERDDVHHDAEPSGGRPPMPAASGRDPLPVAIRPRPVPEVPVVLSAGDRLRASASLVTMMVLIGMNMMAGV